MIDAGSLDASTDARETMETGGRDAGRDAGRDTGMPIDIGPVDTGMIDAASEDTGVDAPSTTDDTGVDAAMPDDTGVDADMPDGGTDAYVFVMACGDGSVDGTETCDDMDLMPGDGCDASCHIESGWSCMGEPSVCMALCGNGALDPTEMCDDGALAAGDGCSATCQLEPGWTCPATVPTRGCTTDCGDGVTAVGREECDDGNMTDGDGCDDGLGPDVGGGPAWLPACLTTRCGNGVPTGTEACDAGNTTPGDGCSATCTIE
ncbi:MAG: DUF4215 domain-containing protein [Sandaracinus sp.]